MEREERQEGGLNRANPEWRNLWGVDNEEGAGYLCPIVDCCWSEAVDCTGRMGVYEQEIQCGGIDRAIERGESVKKIVTTRKSRPKGSLI